MIINPPAPAGSSAHRLKRGSKASDVTPLNGSNTSKDDLLSSIDGPFQLAEYLACKVRADPHDVKGLVEVPKDGHDADRDVWIYEHLRRLPVDLAPLVSQLLTICSRDTCPSMKADEWLYLCVAHGSGGTEECCAIDYILHTLDSTTTLLNSTKSFPSRMSIPASSLNNFPSLSRRLSRIFSHAYFHHREAFLTFEAESSLYERFMALCETYGLVGSSLLVIPKGELGIGRAGEEDEDEEDSSSDEEEEEEEKDEKGEKEEDQAEHEEVGHRATKLGRKSLLARTCGKSNGATRAKSLDRRASTDNGQSHTVPEHTDSGGNTKPRKSVVPRASAVAAIHAQNQAQTPAQEPMSAESKFILKAPTEQTEIKHDNGQNDESHADVPESAIKATTRGRGRGTLGRGKQSRGTVLWSSDSAPPIPSTEPSAPAPASAKDNKESTEETNGGHDNGVAGISDVIDGKTKDGKDDQEEQLAKALEEADL